METTTRIDFERKPGLVTAILTLTAPSGASTRYVATVDDDDMRDFTQALAEGESAPDAENVGVSAPGASLWWWKAVSAKALGKAVNDEKARAAWWNGMTPDKREWSRAMFRGVQAWGLEGDPAAGHAQLLKVGKEGRERILHRYKRGLWDAGRVSKKAGDIALTVAPIVLAAIPGIGPVAAGAAALAIAAARKVAAGKAMDVAAIALEAGAKASGQEIPPALKEVVAKLGASSRLSVADAAQAAGAPNAAKVFAKRAAEHVAKRLAPAKAREVLLKANDSRKRVAALAEGRKLSPMPPPGSKASAKRAPAPAPSQRAPDVLARARAGKLRSNQGGKVSPAELVKAAASGRVFFVSAA
jgi:hypothetical protein